MFPIGSPYAAIPPLGPTQNESGFFVVRTNSIEKDCLHFPELVLQF